MPFLMPPKPSDRGIVTIDDLYRIMAEKLKELQQERGEK